MKRARINAGADPDLERARVWIEHSVTKKRGYSSKAEVDYQREQTYQRVIKFAEDNIPGYAEDRAKRLPFLQPKKD